MLFQRRLYKVRMTGRAGIIYSEGDKKMKVDSEMILGSGDYDLAIRKESIRKWEAPHGGEISSEERERICKNIEEALGGSKILWE